MPQDIEFHEFPLTIYEWEAIARNKGGNHFGVSIRIRAPNAEMAERLAHEAAVRHWKDCTFISPIICKIKEDLK